MFTARRFNIWGAALLHSLDTTSSTRKTFEHAYLGRQEEGIAVDNGYGTRQGSIHITARNDRMSLHSGVEY